ncbi:hypothetical protein ABGT24_00600 [Peribacillus frigoritolerans]|uniref:hypothetical protein n=1 Tax=Peribacillus frigoritolerans TaxID=450367 RepID=UPI00345D646F
MKIVAFIVVAYLIQLKGIYFNKGLNRNWAGSIKKVKVFPLIVDIYNNIERNDYFLSYPYTIPLTGAFVEDH